jgi:hypothetical protein
MKSSQAIEQKRGLIVIIVLAAFTAIEFGVSVTLPNPNLLLTATALVKAGLIIYYFMQVAELWRKEA